MFFASIFRGTNYTCWTAAQTPSSPSLATMLSSSTARCTSSDGWRVQQTTCTKRESSAASAIFAQDRYIMQSSSTCSVFSGLGTPSERLQQWLWLFISGSYLCWHGGRPAYNWRCHHCIPSTRLDIRERCLSRWNTSWTSRCNFCVIGKTWGPALNEGVVT